MHTDETREERTLEELSDEYLAHLEAKACSAQTVRARRIQLSHLTRYCTDRGISYPAGVTREMIEQLILEIRHRKNRKGETIRSVSAGNWIYAFHVFFLWLAKRRLVLFNPVRALLPRKKRQASLPRHVLTDREMEKVLSLPDTGTFRGLRDRAVLELFYSTGIRRSEMTKLLVSDIHSESGTLFVRQGKGRKDRIVPLGERALLYLRRYLAEARPSYVKRADPGYLFLSQYGRGLSPQSLTTHFGRDYLRKIKKPGACHIFRHTAATLMHENGADIRHVQEILGHSSPETTQIYTNVSIARLKETYRRTNPAALQEREECFPETQSEIRRGYVFPVKSRHPTQKEALPEEGLFSLVARYDRYLEARGYATATRDSRRYALKFFAQWCLANDIGEACAITSDVLEAYRQQLFAHQRANGGSLSLIYQYRSLFNVSQFCRFLFESGETVWNAADGFELKNPDKKLPSRTLSAKEVERVMRSPDARVMHGLRDRVALEILFSTAMRVGELAALCVEDIHFDACTVYIREGKSAKARIVPISKRAIDWTRRYLEVRTVYPGYREDVPFVFFTESGGKVRHLKDFLARHFRKAGIEKGSCHLLRHTVATLMLEAGADLRVLQEFLGHRYLRTTQVYTRVSIKNLKEIHAKTHPAEIRLRERKKRMQEEEAKEEANREELRRQDFPVQAQSTFRGEDLVVEKSESARESTIAGSGDVA